MIVQTFHLYVDVYLIVLVNAAPHPTTVSNKVTKLEALTSFQSTLQHTVTDGKSNQISAYIINIIRIPRVTNDIAFIPDSTVADGLSSGTIAGIAI